MAREVPARCDCDQGSCGRAIVVSPHLDDAAFSCPCRIAALASLGSSPLVCTVFTRGSRGEPLRDRIAEDLASAGAGGFEVAHGPFVDAPFRPRPRADFMSIVFGEEPDRESVAGEIASWIGGLLSSARPSLLLAPLGVGRHVDHRLAFEACIEAARDFRGVRVEFYEDRPYAFVDQAVEMRLAELGFDSRPDLRRFFNSLFESRYVKAFLPPESAEACKTAYETLARQADEPRPVPESATLLRGDASSAWKAASAYGSQLCDFTGDSSAFALQCALAASGIVPGAAYVERTWKLPL